MIFDKSLGRLHFLLMSFMLTKFEDNQISITIKSIKYLNFKFLYKIMYKYELMD